jgi:hypothetical protein
VTDRITSTMLDRWRADPATFIETVLHDPDTGTPFVLLDCERRFIAEMFKTDDDGHLVHTDLIYSCPKKTGKTTFAGILDAGPIRHDEMVLAPSEPDRPKIEA